MDLTRHFLCQLLVPDSHQYLTFCSKPEKYWGCTPLTPCELERATQTDNLTSRRRAGWGAPGFCSPIADRLGLSLIMLQPFISRLQSVTWLICPFNLQSSQRARWWAMSNEQGLCTLLLHRERGQRDNKKAFYSCYYTCSWWELKLHFISILSGSSHMNSKDI